MPGQKRDELLTTAERLRLINRQDADDKTIRAANDIRVRKKLSAWLKNIPDVLLILEKLPEDQINTVLTPRHMTDLMKVLGKSLEVFPPTYVEQVGENEYQTVRYFQVIFGSDFAKLEEDDASSFVNVTCPASDEEKEYWDIFEYFSNYLFKRISEVIRNIPRLCTTRRFDTVILPAMNEIANKRGVFCKVEPVVVMPTELKKSSKSTKNKPK